MTISSTALRSSTAGNGTTTAFTFPYLFFAEDDLTVILVVDSTNVETTQTITTHYTVAGAGVAAGGTVTMVTAPAVGETLVVLRDEQFTQGLDLVENDPFPSDLVEQQFDILTMLAQQLKDTSDRSVKLSDGDTSGANTTLPTPAADTFIGWDAAGTALVNTATSASSAAAAAASATAAAASATAASAYAGGATQLFVGGVGFTAGSSNTVVVAGVVVTDEALLQVWMDGVKQFRDTWALTNNGTDTTITFDAAIPTGVLKIEVDWGVRTTVDAAASLTSAGIVELATVAETNTGTDATRAVTPDSLNDWTGGSSAITKLGTIATGTWQGTAINQTYLTGQSGTNTGDEVAASLTVAGVVERSTSAENVTGSSDTVYPTVAGVHEMIDQHAPGATSASLTAQGVVELATVAETNTGTDATRAVTPDGLNDWTGGGALVTKLGTIATGVWQGTAINQTYLTGQSGTNTGDEAAADLTTSGTVELATIAETNTGTDATRAVTPDGLNDWTGGGAAVTKLGTIATGVWQGTAINQTYLTGQSGTNTGDEVAADLTTAGVVELATVAETNTGSDAGRAVTPAGLTGWTGDTAVVTVGTIGTGTWQGTAVNQTYLVGQSGTNTGDEVASSLTTAGVVELATIAETNTGTDATRAVTPDGLDGWTGAAAIVTVGTIGTGTWQGTAVAQAYIADNAISLAKMAGGTDGNIISFDASGDPVAIATGNDGQVLTSAGAGAQPAFEDAAGGSGADATAFVVESAPGTAAVATGTDDIAIGETAVANGASAIAIGVASDAGNASGDEACIAIGAGTQALGKNGLAIGHDAIASAEDGLAIGHDATASAEAGIAIGQAASASVARSIAIGHSAVADTDEQGIAIGYQADAGGNSSVSIGYDAHTTASTSCAIGSYGAVASAENAHAFGFQASASGVNSLALGYLPAATANGQKSFASGQFGAVGDAQAVTFVARGATTDATVTKINPDGGTTNDMSLPINTMWGFEIDLVVREQATGDSKKTHFSGAIKRNGSSTTALVGSVVESATVNDSGATWTAAVTADNSSREALQIAVTGEASHTLRWVARIEIVAVSG